MRNPAHCLRAPCETRFRNPRHCLPQNVRATRGRSTCVSIDLIMSLRLSRGAGGSRHVLHYRQGSCALRTPCRARSLAATRHRRGKAPAVRRRVSDIPRGQGEPETKLGVRLTGIGVDLPIVFFIAQLDDSMSVPYGAVAISNDMVAMLTSVLCLLRPDAAARSVRSDPRA
jgi:hypothetical protein